MDIEKAKEIIGDNDLSIKEVSVLLERAKKMAKNHYFWHPKDNPTEEEQEAFYDRYEYEIYDIANEMHSVLAREGLKQFTELGVTRVWAYGGFESVSAIINSTILPKTYTL